LFVWFCVCFFVGVVVAEVFLAVGALPIISFCSLVVTVTVFVASTPQTCNPRVRCMEAEWKAEFGMPSTHVAAVLGHCATILYFTWRTDYAGAPLLLPSLLHANVQFGSIS